MDSRREEIDVPEKETCLWPFEHPSFQAWRQGNGILALIGDPGAGKSTAMRQIHRDLEVKCGTDEVLIGCYCWML